jgi:hypothetical protein
MWSVWIRGSTNWQCCVFGRVVVKKPEGSNLTARESEQLRPLSRNFSVFVRALFFLWDYGVCQSSLCLLVTVPHSKMIRAFFFLLSLGLWRVPILTLPLGYGATFEDDAGFFLSSFFGIVACANPHSASWFQGHIRRTDFHLL